MESEQAAPSALGLADCCWDIGRQSTQPWPEEGAEKTPLRTWRTRGSWAKGVCGGGVFTFLCVHGWECECVYESVGVCVHVYMCVYLCVYGVFQVVLVVKNLPASAGGIRDVDSIPGSGKAPGGGQGNPLQCSCLEDPLDRGAWWATVYRVSETRTQLKWLSTHTRVCLGTCVSVWS